MRKAQWLAIGKQGIASEDKIAGNNQGNLTNLARENLGAGYLVQRALARSK